MITHIIRRCVSCDGCGYVIEGLYPDLSNRKEHEITVLERWGETFHFHAATERDCYPYFQRNVHVRVGAMMDREAARASEDGESDARNYFRDNRAELKKKFEELVADEQHAAA